MSRAFLGAVLAALVLPAFAHAASLTPVVAQVSAPDRHPTVSWILPQHVEAEAVEVATSPAIGDYDQFLEKNVIIGEAVASDATTWSDALTRLDPGTYYVHVLGWDDSCDVDENLECEHVVSPTVTLVVRNTPPRVRAVHMIVQGTTVHASVTLCDDASGRATVIVRQRRKQSGRTLARYTRGLRLDAKAGCNTYHLTATRTASLGGRGKLVVTFQVLDYDGGYSNVAVGKRGPPPT